MINKMAIFAALIILSSPAFAEQDSDLIIASSLGLADYVISLIESGADVNAVDGGGNTAVRVAYEGGFGELVGVLFDAGAEIYSTLNDSSVRIRNLPTTSGSMTIGSLNRGDRVVILGRSRDKETISSMTAYWYKIRTEDGIVGYSFGYFFDTDPRDLPTLPTFYFNYKYGFSFTFPVTWEGWIVTERKIDYGFGVTPVPGIDFGLPDQSQIFVIIIYTADQWEKLSNIEEPDGVSGNPIAGNNRYLIDYGIGHYAANDDMIKRRGEVQYLLKTIEVNDVATAD